MRIIPTGLSRGLALMNTPGRSFWRPQRHPRSGPKKPVPSLANQQQIGPGARRPPEPEMGEAGQDRGIREAGREGRETPERSIELLAISEPGEIG